MFEKKNLDFEDFKKLAKDKELSKYEKIGFFNHLRKGFEKIIFKDILRKLTNLEKSGQVILDIGAGCSDLPMMLIEHCQTHGHTLILIDSEDMLDLLPDKDFIVKVSGQFPLDMQDFIDSFRGKVDVILSYSVFHYVFDSLPYNSFVDQAISLLADEGQFLLGDLPNFNKKNRFFNSEAGVRYHQENSKEDSLPKLDNYTLPYNTMDDGVIYGLLSRARNSGIESYLMPQPQELPMGNRREDILFVKH
ncbi:MAG: class I SAM-dependent methyltransferase [Reichenbachiella sp.]|uniref:class I SAM-dependent methyltransferase n=1 Tax=Reichenbachiella sp. TaxID=2184521 RepID=UPI003265993F